MPANINQLYPHFAVSAHFLSGDDGFLLVEHCTLHLQLTHSGPIHLYLNWYQSRTTFYLVCSRFTDIYWEGLYLDI